MDLGKVSVSDSPRNTFANHVSYAEKYGKKKKKNKNPE